MLKLLSILDILLIIFVIISNIYLNLPSEIISLLLGITLALTFLIIFLFVVASLKKFFMRKRTEEEKSNYKIPMRVYALGFFLSIAVFYLAFNYSLYVQALLGNDIFLSLNLKQENFVMYNGDYLYMPVDFGIIANPFCSAYCSLSLKDLSSGKILYSESLPVFVSNPESKEYEIFINESYSGQKLYRVDFECISQKQRFCYTSKTKSKHTSKIISIEHQFNQQQNQYFKEIRDKVVLINNKYYQLIYNINQLNDISSNPYLDLSVLRSEIKSLSYNMTENNIDLILKLYSEQKFSNLVSLLQEKETYLNKFNQEFSEINNSILREVYIYNNLVNDFYSLESNLSYLNEISLGNDSIISANNFIDSYNSALVSFSKFSDLNSKINLLSNLLSLRNNLSLSNQLNESLKLEKKLNPVNLVYLNLNFTSVNVNINFTTPSSVCCLSNKCGICLDEKYSSINYPIILLHGHSFNEKTSALSSLEDFNSFQNTLENDGFINAGSLLYSDYTSLTKGFLGKINTSVVIKASYYFDILSNEQGYSLLETKTDNIDTYAIRLKDIINNVKYITGKDKVIIIAHSMGGLVSRRYIQVFGSENVHKLILIAVPNQGVDGFVADYCSILGTNEECDDMKAGSLFLSKLNRGENPSIPVHNIIGEGCLSENSIGDGIVKSDSAYLSFAKNYYVSGNCEKFSYFHNSILDAEKYPKAYNIVREILHS